MGSGADGIYLRRRPADAYLPTDHQCQIQYDGIILNGGKQTADNTYRSSDGKFIYTLIPSLGTPNLLSITGPDGNLLIQDFTPGDLNITLNPADPLPPAQNILTGDQSQPGYYDDIDAAPATDAIYGLGGGDVLSGHAGKNGYVPTVQLYGGTGNDIIYGEYFYTSEYYRLGPATFQTQYGDQVTLTGLGPSLYGEAGLDTLLGSLMDDTMDGGADPDYATGYLGNDTLIGGLGNDILDGDEGRDVLQGDDGVDLLGGGAGADVLLGGAEADRLYGDSHYRQPVPPWDGVTYTLLVGINGLIETLPIVKDVPEAQAGDDELHSDDGNDGLYGGHTLFLRLVSKTSVAYRLAA
ncbi:MAG: calcium-binding protein [Sulfuricaulis sp.]|nr:calcium-binding protein [Sulfuricaulis sp.]